MAFAALTSILTGGLTAAPITAIGLIPLLALGINFYRYASVDPEGRPIDAQKVSCSRKKKSSENFFLVSQ